MVDLKDELQQADIVCTRGRQLLSTSGPLPQADRWLQDFVDSLTVLEREVNNPSCPNLMKQRLLSRISIISACVTT